MTDARGIDLEIYDDSIRINGVEVLVADTPIEISPVRRSDYVTVTMTLFVNSLTVKQSAGASRF